jgi:hypothetical protein
VPRALGREGLKDPGPTGVVSGETGRKGAWPTRKDEHPGHTTTSTPGSQRWSGRFPWRRQRRPPDLPVDPDLRDALARLDVRSRSALLLNAVDGYTQGEVAGILGIAEGSVGRIVSEARAALLADRDRTADRVG